MDFKLNSDRLEKRFQDAKPLLTDSEAAIEANRCLNCYDAPCITACPTGIDIPAFIKKIASGNISGSAKTILEANMLGYSTSRVCPVEELCVGACVYNDLNHTPIQIGRLQRYAMEKAFASEAKNKKPLFSQNGSSIDKSVALIGAGPASLACAAYLALEGIKTVIFEKGDLPGGLNTTAVAPYKLQTENSLAEVQWLLDLGVELKTGVEIGQNITFEQLLEDHDAVFIGTGLGQDRSLELPGWEGAGTWGATQLIQEIKNNPDFELPAELNTALVIGGGNTAIDIARELAMLGVNDVRMVYRKTQKEMSGYTHEIAGASHYGVRLLENALPTAVNRENGAIKSLSITSTIADETDEIPCDWVIEAIGQLKHVQDLTSFVDLDSSGCIVVDENTMLTNHEKIYAGGDCINGGKEVVNAAADGREAAKDMLKRWGITPNLHGNNYFKSLSKDIALRVYQHG